MILTVKNQKSLKEKVKDVVYSKKSSDWWKHKQHKKQLSCHCFNQYQMDRVKRIWYLSHMRAAKVQASLRIRAVSPEPPLLAHTSSESRGTFRQRARSLAPLNGWACAVKTCHDGMLEDTNSLDAAQIRAEDQLNRSEIWRKQLGISQMTATELFKTGQEILIGSWGNFVVCYLLLV